jgi:hypothetical protein
MKGCGTRPPLNGRNVQRAVYPLRGNGVKPFIRTPAFNPVIGVHHRPSVQRPAGHRLLVMRRGTACRPPGPFQDAQVPCLFGVSKPPAIACEHNLPWEALLTLPGGRFSAKWAIPSCSLPLRLALGAAWWPLGCDSVPEHLVSPSRGISFGEPSSKPAPTV